MGLWDHLGELRRLEIDLVTLDLLHQAGYTTIEALRAASDGELLAVRGLGPATLRQIRGALGRLDDSDNLPTG